MRLTMVNGAVYENYHGLWSCILGLPLFMELYIRLTMVNDAAYEVYHMHVGKHRLVGNLPSDGV